MSPLTWPPAQADIDRFWRRTHSEGDCLIWDGTPGRQSYYGCFKIGGRANVKFVPHDFAWQLAHGPKPKSSRLRQIGCGNKLCVQPSHWELPMKQTAEQLQKNHVMRERQRRAKPAVEVAAVEEAAPKAEKVSARNSNGRPVGRPKPAAGARTVVSITPLSPVALAFRRWCDMLGCRTPAVWLFIGPYFGEQWLCEQHGMEKNETGLFPNRLRRVEVTG